MLKNLMLSYQEWCDEVRDTQYSFSYVDEPPIASNISDKTPLGRRAERLHGKFLELKLKFAHGNLLLFNAMRVKLGVKRCISTSL